MRRLKHCPGIVQLLDSFEDEEHVHLVQVVIDGLLRLFSCTVQPSQPQTPNVMASGAVPRRRPRRLRGDKWVARRGEPRSGRIGGPEDGEELPREWRIAR